MMIRLLFGKAGGHVLEPGVETELDLLLSALEPVFADGTRVYKLIHDAFVVRCEDVFAANCLSIGSGFHPS